MIILKSRKWIMTLVAGLLGLVLDILPIQSFEGAQWLLGSVPALGVLIIYGLFPGFLAALPAAGYFMFLQGRLPGLVVFTLEAAAVGALLYKWEKVYQRLEEKHTKLTLLTENLRALNAITTDISCNLNLDLCLKTITEALVKKYGAALARIWLIKKGDLCEDCYLAEDCPDKQLCLHLKASSRAIPSATPGRTSKEQMGGGGQELEESSPSATIHSKDRRIPVGAFIAGRVACNKRPFISYNPANDEKPPLNAWIQEAGIKFFAAYPLIYRETLIGVLGVYTYEELSEGALEVLEFFSKHAAVAINDAILYENMEEMVKAKTEELERKNAELEAVNRMKDEFLANMSHELRTPLSSIMALSQLLMINKDLDEAQRKRAEVIYRNGSELLNIINDILDLSKIEAKRMELHYAAHRVSAIISEILQMILPVVEERKKELTKLEARDRRPEVDQDSPAFPKKALLNFKVDLDPDIPTAIFTDAGALRRIVMNLLSNALKFTERGEIALKVDVASNLELPSSEGADETKTPQDSNPRTRLFPDKEYLRVSVSDTGIGIDKRYQELIFEGFRQVDSSMQRKYKGTGLGLTISRKLVRMLGGDLTVRSAPGEGSTFTLIVPMRRALIPEEILKTLEEQERAVRDELKAAASRLVLLVEDDPSNQFSTREVLEQAGYQVAVACDGQEGIDEAPRLRPDVILMNLSMPVKDGLEATRELREMRELDKTPIIIMTANLVKEEDARKFLEAGCDDYITKPLDNNLLIEKIMRMLGDIV